jgi:hypothetical protein
VHALVVEDHIAHATIEVANDGADLTCGKDHAK